ncbi:MAG: hypothetical protein M3Q23_08800 [Actinomycetota bacterium]|nr:hypothetical protein [Actinomycetota bacterium]
MRRLFWTAVGVGAGATAAFMVSRWMRRTREAMAPANVAREAGRSVTDLVELVRQSVAAGRTAMAEREAEIRGSLESE